MVVKERKDVLEHLVCLLAAVSPSPLVFHCQAERSPPVGVDLSDRLTWACNLVLIVKGKK